jgi:putative FmdB family regulatory protein
MPIYEYDCRDCGAHFEVLLRTRSDKPKQCPSCGRKKLVKAFSTFAVSAPDPSPHCESCPTASSSCASGACASNACPFS